MAEVWFYHLERETVEAVLPGLLGRGLERNLRMAVETTDGARIKSLSDHLWAHEDVSFLPHAAAEEATADRHAIVLACGDANPNGAAYRFYVDGALPVSLEGLARASVMFNGLDADAVQLARDLWRRLKAEGHAIRYNKQDETGRWQDLTAA